MNPRIMGLALCASMVCAAPAIEAFNEGRGERRNRGGKRLDRDLNPASQPKPKSESLSRILGKAKRGGRV